MKELFKKGLGIRRIVFICLVTLCFSIIGCSKDSTFDQTNIESQTSAVYACQMCDGTGHRQANTTVYQMSLDWERQSNTSVCIACNGTGYEGGVTGNGTKAEYWKRDHCVEGVGNTVDMSQFMTGKEILSSDDERIISVNGNKLTMKSTGCTTVRIETDTTIEKYYFIVIAANEYKSAKSFNQLQLKIIPIGSTTQFNTIANGDITIANQNVVAANVNGMNLNITALDFGGTKIIVDFRNLTNEYYVIAYPEHN